jgi:hypothetical protein
MYETNLHFLRTDIDSTAFDELYHSERNTDLVFYEKSYDGGEHHEIHTIYIVEHDSNDLTKPYVIYVYHKEYMWNWHTSFEQEDCDLHDTIEKHTLSEVMYYLQEKNIITEKYTGTLVDKNSVIKVDRSVCKYLTYTISTDWSDDMGDYTDLLTYTLDLDSIDETCFDLIHTKIITYFKQKVDILITTPSYIINKMLREHIGPFTIHTSEYNNRYSFWREEEEEEEDEQSPSGENTKVIIKNYSKPKEYTLYDVRIDVFHLNDVHSIIHNDLVYIKKIPFDYDVFYVYSNIFDPTTYIWSYDMETDNIIDPYDSYWSVYDGRLHERSKLQSYHNNCIRSLLLEYTIQDKTIVANANDTNDTSYFQYLPCTIS